ncbi:MAG: ABC transporter ATP-binding protein [bacterium]
MILQTKNLTKKFGGLVAVNNVTLDIDENKVYGLIGPNGAGKTTLINIINGYLKPDNGKIFLYGKEITGFKPHQLAKLNVARSFQTPRIFGDLTVLENALTVLNDEGECNKILDEFGLERVKNKKASELSYGEKKALDIVRALLLRPKILLLDEPLAGLDIKTKLDMLERLSELKKNKLTIMLIEHNLEELFSISDYIYVMHLGEIVDRGYPDYIRQSKKVQEVYFSK